MLRQAQALLARGPAVSVRVARVEGSGPREPGAWMLVGAEGIVGTIGGGQLEHDAIATARGLLGSQDGAREEKRYALGPSLGQCCGGVVHLAFARASTADLAEIGRQLDAAAMPVALFGGGHVGRAIVRLCEDLPLRLAWVDSREGVFPPDVPANVQCEHSEPVHRAVPLLAPGSRVLVMSFSHAEDLDIVAACLQRHRERGDLPFLGLIGSKTKWATFRHRLEHRGFSAGELAAVHCPIGVPGIPGKEPAVIALAAVAQLLQARAPAT